MKFEFFHYTSEVTFFIGFIVVMLFSAELAYLHGKNISKKHKVESADLSANAATISGTMLGLLALLLGFAFSMAMGRFEKRKELLLEEVNDIQTTYLRIDLLNAEHSKNLKRLFADYTQLRLDYYKPDVVAKNLNGSLNETVELQKEIWVKSIEALNAHKTPPLALAYINVLNSVFDDQTKRTIVRDNHLPEQILWLLILVALIANSTGAYALGLKHVKIFLPRALFIMVIAAVLTVILDLDRPTRGFIRIDQSSMINLHSEISKDVASLK